MSIFHPHCEEQFHQKYHIRHIWLPTRCPTRSAFSFWQDQSICPKILINTYIKKTYSDIFVKKSCIAPTRNRQIKLEWKRAKKIFSFDINVAVVFNILNQLIYRLKNKNRVWKNPTYKCNHALRDGNADFDFLTLRRDANNAVNERNNYIHFTITCTTNQFALFDVPNT
jgi:hypothetical protein